MKEAEIREEDRDWTEEEMGVWMAGEDYLTWWVMGEYDWGMPGNVKERWYRDICGSEVREKPTTLGV